MPGRSAGWQNCTKRPALDRGRVNPRYHLSSAPGVPHSRPQYRAEPVGSLAGDVRLAQPRGACRRGTGSLDGNTTLLFLHLYFITSVTLIETLARRGCSAHTVACDSRSQCCANLSQWHYQCRSGTATIPMANACSTYGHHRVQSGRGDSRSCRAIASRSAGPANTI